MSIYKAQCMVLPVPSPVDSTCCLNLESVEFSFFPPLTNNDYGYRHPWLVHERVWCAFERLLSRGIGHRNLFWQYFPSNSMVFTCMEILYNHIHQVDGSKWHAAFEWTLQNVRQTCLSTITTCLYMLIRSPLTKSDTNGGYHQFLEMAVVSEPDEPILAKGLAKSVSTIILVLYSS